MDHKTVIDRISFEENDLDVESKIQGEYHMPGTAGFIPTTEIKIQQVESVMIENPSFANNRNEDFNLFSEKEDLPEETLLSESAAVERTSETEDLSKEGEEGFYHSAEKLDSREQSSPEKKSGNRKYIIIAIIILILLLTKCLG